MPIKSCQEKGKPGFKAGDTGKCYTYSNEASRQRAIEKAKAQLRAMKTRQGAE